MESSLARVSSKINNDSAENEEEKLSNNRSSSHIA
jgi:hypothetical protein